MSDCTDPPVDDARCLHAADGRCWRETPAESHDDAVALGTNGGLTTSPAKTAAARDNGKSGGWWSWHDYVPTPPKSPPVVNFPPDDT